MAKRLAAIDTSMSTGERETRRELAAAFRVAYRFGWNRTISNHMTARLPDNPNHFLMNARGFGWHEITPDRTSSSSISMGQRAEQKTS